MSMPETAAGCYRRLAHRENFFLIHRLFYALRHVNLHPFPKVLEFFLLCFSALYYNNCGYLLPMKVQYYNIM